MSEEVRPLAEGTTPQSTPSPPIEADLENVALESQQPRTSENSGNGVPIAASHDEAAALSSSDEPEPVSEELSTELAVDESESEEEEEAEEAPEAAIEELDSDVSEAVKPEPPKKRWYVVKVQSGREDTIKEAIERRVRKEGLEEYFGQIVIPVEKYQEIKTDKNGKRVTRTKERKLYPGYLMVEVDYNDRVLYLFRETSGVGDFVGAHPGDLTRAPTPMTPREVERMIGKAGKSGEKEEPVSPKPKWLQEGDRVRVADGTFNGMDGVVTKIKEAESKVEVQVTIFGRPVPVELEYYQVEQL